MKMKKILIVAFFLLLIFCKSVNASDIEITATSSTVINCIDGKILYSKNMDERLYPASLTNVLTALLVVENCNMQDEVQISQNAIKNVESGYLTANIQEGEVLKVEQLLNLLFISSYNDVANALAEHVAGSTEAFVQMMNNKAKEIGCTNSNFINCNGEHNIEHYSTAHDMALIGQYAMQYDEIRKATQKISCELGVSNKYEKNDRIYYTTNEMLLSGSPNYYKYAKGIKAGFTTPAGNCLMAYIEKDDIPVIAVALKSTTSDSRYEDVIKAINYVYDTNTLKIIAKAGENIQTLNVKKATKNTKKLNIVLENDVKAVVKIENAKIKPEPHIELRENLQAPIEKGEIIGKVTYELEGKNYSGNLIAESKVEKKHKGLFFTLTFFGILLLIGSLRIIGLYKRNKTLRKIR